MENIMLCQAEYDLAVTVGSQGSAAACKERETVFFSQKQICKLRGKVVHNSVFFLVFRYNLHSDNYP